MEKKEENSCDYTHSISNVDNRAILHFYEKSDDMPKYKAIIWLIFMGFSTISLIASIWLWAFKLVSWPLPSMFVILIIIAGSLVSNRKSA